MNIKAKFVEKHLFGKILAKKHVEETFYLIRLFFFFKKKKVELESLKLEFQDFSQGTRV